jgi:hypothetical protein
MDVVIALRGKYGAPPASRVLDSCFFFPSFNKSRDKTFFILQKKKNSKNSIMQMTQGGVQIAQLPNEISLKLISEKEPK